MKIKPYADDKWFRIPPRKHPDKLMMDYLTGQGEFSAVKAIEFDKHIKKVFYELKGFRREAMKDEPSESVGRHS